MTAPYYRDDQVTLYHGDCLEITEWLEADVLVTDPPYGIRHESRFGDGRLGTKDQIRQRDSVRSDTDTATRDSVLTVWGDKPAIVFGSWRMPRPTGVRSLLIWHKANGWPGAGSMAFFTNHDDIYVIGEGWRKSTSPLRSVITTAETRHHQPGKTGHPTSKPVNLMEQLVDRCPPGLIADPFAGSGSTLVAARNLGRKAIGVEIEERYCELIARRLDQQCFDFEEPA